MQPLVLHHPKILILSVVMSFLTAITAVWLVIHPPLANSSNVSLSKTTELIVQQNTESKSTANPRATPKNPKKPDDKKISHIATVAQDGNGNQQTVNQAPVTQSNSGGCNQQVVGGNNNTNNCDTPPKIIAAELSSVATGDLYRPWATTFVIHSTALVRFGDLRVEASHPLIGIDILPSREDRLSCTGKRFIDPHDPQIAVFQICESEIMSPDMRMTIRIFSTEPVKIIDASIGSTKITF